MSELPRLGADTLQTRAAQSGQIWEARQRARQQVSQEFESVEDPDKIPIRRRDRGFAPGREFLEWAEPQEAAFQIDPEFPRQDLGPSDVERVDGGFRPTEDVRRRSAAYEFEEETPLDDVNPFGDLVAQDGGFGLAEGPQREIAARELNPLFPGVELERQDVQRSENGFGLTPGAEREVAAAELEQETPLEEVESGDVRRTGDGFELRESVIEANRGLFY